MFITKIVKFGLVGIINTLIDFGIYNFVTGKRFRLPRIKANLISTTTAMIFSFFANRGYVFKPHGGNLVLQAVLFYAVTAFGLYVLQTLVIHFLSHKWKQIPDTAVSLVRSIGIKRQFSDDFISKNAVKLAATGVSLIWNFLLFQYVVFKV